MRSAWAIILCAAIQAAVGPVFAEESADSAASGLSTRRIVHRYDFDERKLGNFESMPMHWFRIHRDGYPRYSNMGFDKSHVTTGEYAFRIEPNGGSAGVVLEPGALAAMPDADYLVTARLRTEKMKHARAMISGQFLDGRRRPIDASRAATPMVTSNGKWTTLSFRLSGRHAGAAWIVLRMEVLQPTQFNASQRNRLGQHKLNYTDIHAAAWFEDVTVYQLPRIELATDTPIGLSVADAPPFLIANVRDLSGTPLDSRIDVYDMTGRLIDSMQRTKSQAGRARWSWKPKLPRFGWYWAELNVYSGRELVGRRQTAFAYLPQPLPANHEQAERFVLVAERLGPEHRPLLLPLMERTNGGALVLSAWSALIGDDPQDLAKQPADPLLMALASGSCELTLSFDRVPEALARKTTTDIDAPLGMFTLPYEQWRTPFEALLIRYGRTVKRWQIGATGSGAAYWHDDLPNFYPKLYERFHQFLAHPKVAMAWQAHQTIPQQAKPFNALTMHLPHSVRPEDIPRYAQTWPTDTAELTVVLETLPSGPYAHPQRAEDLALRMIHTWQTPVQRLAIDAPWRTTDGREPGLMPDPLLAVWSNVAGQLAGRRIVGRINLGKGLHCLVLDGKRGGALVAWNRNADQPRVSIPLYLGAQPRVVDLWGNRVSLELTQNGRHQLELTSAPVFFEDIDIKLARLRSSFKIDPPFVRSVYKVHQHTLELTNPYPRSIHGTLRITGPEHWKIGPQLFHYNALPGETVRLPIELNFPISELEGEKQLTAMLELDGETERAVELAAPLSLGLKQVLYTPTLHVERSAQRVDGDVVVTALVTNIGDKPQSFYAFALAHDQPRLERIVSRLAPGQTMLKRFRFINAARELSGSTIRTGLREMNGPAILNTTVQVP